MKKIPTLFVRTFENHNVVGITDQITAGCEEAFHHGDATVKFDGACCAIIGGELYKRYDAKKGRKPPEGAIPCCDPDPVTGHHPHWVKVDKNNPADKWFIMAYERAFVSNAMLRDDWTYEAFGKHFNGNPYEMTIDFLVPHGMSCADDVERTFAGVKSWLEAINEEGLVFWLDGAPVCKIRRKDFGLPWPVKDGENE